jgi:Homing endonuclease associated repeat
MKTGPRDGFSWTRENIVYAIELWHRRHLYAPTVEEWEQAGDDHPCRQTVLRVFGSWSAAIRAAGLRPRARGEHLRQQCRRRCPEAGRLLWSEEVG